MYLAAATIAWFEGPDTDQRWVYGFKTAEQSAAFKAWSVSCDIDWSVRPDEQPIDSRPTPGH